MKKLTRRELVGGAAVLLGDAAVLPSLEGAKTAAPQTGTSAADWAKAAREANRANSDALAAVSLAMSAEPAFRFNA